MTVWKNRAVCCPVCKTRLFYIPEGYVMGCKIICTHCKDGTTQKKTPQTAAGRYARAKKGIRKDVHPTYFFRSKTEANVARILNHIGSTWEFEQIKFKFSTYKTKPWSYLMDFEIKESNDPVLTPGLYEVKGFFNGASRNKLRRLKKEYPADAERTTVILYSSRNKKDILFCEKHGYRCLFYDELKAKYHLSIPEWE